MNVGKGVPNAGGGVTITPLNSPRRRKEYAMSKLTRTKLRVLVTLGALFASVGLTAAACVGSSPSGFSQPNAQSVVSHTVR